MDFNHLNFELNRRQWCEALLGSGLLGFSHLSSAQSFPSRPVKLVVPFPPGGSTDVIARMMALKLAEALKVAVVVENKPGVGSVLGTDAVAKAAPDGYTLLVSANPAIAPGPLMRSSIPYDAFRDFTHLAVLNYASAGLGSSGFLTGELLKQAAGINIVHVPYKGSGPAITDLLGGQLDGMFESLVTATNYVRSGKLRLLSVSGEVRSKNFPEVPILSEVVPGVVGAAWFGISAPAKLPAPVALRLQTEIQAVVNAPDMLMRLSDMGMTPMPLTGQEFVVFLQAENRKWGLLIRAGKITVE